MQRKAKLAELVNMIPPYKVQEWRRMEQQFDTFIFYSGKEKNRTTWEDVESSLQTAVIKRSWGFTLQFVEKGQRGEVFHYRYLHLTPGYFLDLLRTRPDAVITHEMGLRTCTALLYGSALRKPVWVGWEGTKYTEDNVSVVKRVWRKVIARWAQRWISIGRASTEYLLDLEVPAKQILEIPYTVDQQKYLRPMEPAIHLETRPVFLYVGQFIGRKGLDRLLKVAAEYQKEHRFSLLLVGDGPERASLENLALKLDLRDVHFYPAQYPRDMPAVYHSADYMVLPSLKDGWGVVVNEALWSGVPVLCSVYAGAKELLPSENLFDPLDYGSFSAAFERALEGKIAPPDRTRLKPWEEVADMIIEDIRGTLGP
jgi:glycosyltransferase involved in cell wall biosynthesis